ncbi:serine hydrolase domain-containing protein [Maricaulis sp.]|uniref:serine hydrolase domain-containing protein n=1 Tax=Maricaulis sp. TaxID=1486257 RepID=UPI0025BC535A|nr:serine hydrolase domain-containing protein [Maricaulis sp.]
MFSALATAALLFVQPADLDMIAATTLEASGAPGVAVMRIVGDEVETGVAGLRAIGDQAPIGRDDLWHMGSNSKAMTATLVARLVEQGVVGWDDTIGQHLGDRVPDMDPAYRDLTFRHLLSHRAGLTPNVDMVAMIAFGQQGANGDALPPQRRDYAGRVLTSAPAAEPETDFLYSNAGYVVAGAMLEQATGESWEVLMTREVFEPLGMASAGFGPPGSADIVDQPRGHRGGLFGRRAMAPGPMADNPPVLGPAGTVHVSMADLALFLQAHLAGARGEANGYLSDESWTILHTPPFGGNYAMGWGFNGTQLLHAGSNTMWFVQMVIEPATDRGFVVAFNDGRANVLQAPIGDAIRAMAE